MNFAECRPCNATDERVFLQALGKWKFLIYTSNIHIWIGEYLYFVYKIINCIFV